MRASGLLNRIPAPIKLSQVTDETSSDSYKRLGINTVRTIDITYNCCSAGTWSYPIHSTASGSRYTLEAYFDHFRVNIQFNLSQTCPRIQVRLRMEALRDTESQAAPGAFAGTAAVRCDVAAPAITGANLLRNGLDNVTCTRR